MVVNSHRHWLTARLAPCCDRKNRAIFFCHAHPHAEVLTERRAGESQSAAPWSDGDCRTQATLDAAAFAVDGDDGAVSKVSESPAARWETTSMIAAAARTRLLDFCDGLTSRDADELRLRQSAIRDVVTDDRTLAPSTSTLRQVSTLVRDSGSATLVDALATVIEEELGRCDDVLRASLHLAAGVRASKWGDAAFDAAEFAAASCVAARQQLSRELSTLRPSRSRERR